MPPDFQPKIRFFQAAEERLEKPGLIDPTATASPRRISIACLIFAPTLFFSMS